MSYTQDELDNHSNQLNPNNDAYWQSRGYDKRPDDWDSDYDNQDFYFDDFEDGFIFDDF